MIKLVMRSRWYQHLLKQFESVFSGQTAVLQKLEDIRQEVERTKELQKNVEELKFKLESSLTVIGAQQEEITQLRRQASDTHGYLENIVSWLSGEISSDRQQVIDIQGRMDQLRRQASDTHGYLENIVNWLSEEITSNRQQTTAIQDGINGLSRQVAASHQYLQDVQLWLENIFYDLKREPLPVEQERKSPAYGRMEQIRGLLRLRDVTNVGLVRIGREHDGGYLMADDFHPGMAAYSFGICDDVSWDKDMVERGIECFMYDHTIDALPEEHELFHWSREGICGNEPVENCRTLGEFVKRNGHEGRKDLILKMDVEGAEWDAIAAAGKETLEQFSQIVFELHDMNSASAFESILRVLRKLSETHQPVWVHGNNFADYVRCGDMVMPNALEVLFVRKSDHSFTDSMHFYPLEEDMPNNAFRSDIALGVWNKV